MTNKEAKEKAIRKAWGEWYELMKPYMDEHGGVSTANVEGESWTVLKVRLAASIKKISLNVDEYAYYIPNSIKDIETNNGWTRIEPDGSNLPEKSGDYRFCDMKTYFFKPVVVWFKGNFDSGCNLAFARNYTHYKPIEVEKPPIW